MGYSPRCSPGVTRWSSKKGKCVAIRKPCPPGKYRSKKGGCRSRMHKCPKGTRWIKASRKSKFSKRMVGSCRKPCSNGKKRSSKPNRKGVRLCK